MSPTPSRPARAETAKPVSSPAPDIVPEANEHRLEPYRVVRLALLLGSAGVSVTVLFLLLRLLFGEHDFPAPPP